jgi:hypothetical protein
VGFVQKGLDLIDVGVGDLLLKLLGDIDEGSSLLGVVVDYGVVNLTSGEQVIVVSIEWADLFPE